MSQMLRIIEGISSQQDYPIQLQLILSIVLESSKKNTSRPETIALLETIDSLLSSDSEIVHKFYSVMIIKDLFVKKYSQFMSSLSSSKLLQTMLYIARNVDPDKRVEDKGRLLFTDGDLGNDFVTLILECIVKWSERFPLTSHHSPTRFRIAYQQLLKERVVLPKQFRFFPNDSNKGMINDDKRMSQPNFTGSNLSDNFNAKTIETSVRTSINKVEGFLTFLDQCTDVDKLKMQIDRYHRLFQIEYNRNEANMGRILDQRVLTEQSTNLFLGTQQFYNKENEAYIRCLTDTDDLKGYLDLVAISSQQIRDRIMGKVAKGPKGPRVSSSQMSYNPSGTLRYPSMTSGPTEERVTYQRRVTGVVSDNLSPRVNRNSEGRVEPAFSKTEQSQEIIIYSKKQNEYPVTRNTAYENYNTDENQLDRNSINYTEYRPSNHIEGSFLNRQTQETVRTSGFFNDKQLDSEVEAGTLFIRALLSKESVTKVGFGTVKKQLQQERSLSNRSRNPNRTKRSKSPRPLSRHRRYDEESNFTVSRDISKVEVLQINHNTMVTKNDYSGKLVESCTYDLSDMSFDQGWKKYRKANFKSKGILFQNQHLQIGYKSQAVYQDLQSFSIFIKIGIYIGNKMNDVISSVGLEYEGDQTLIMYCTPKKMEQSIGVAHQAKQDLVFIPLQFPFSPISCQLTYSVKRESHTVVYYLPTSILKLSVMQSTTVSKFNQLYSLKQSSQYRSKPFMLSRDMPPSALFKSFDNCVTLTDYNQFLSQKSYCEYILGLQFQVMESEDYFVKLIVRPDLTAVIQIVPVQSSEESLLYGTTLLQTLQFLLMKEDQP